jgi:outer membrane receptor for ferric coprogen and ferric-rhodotorulic acid
VAHALEQSATSYVGLVVDLSNEISAYGSVSKIFNPQTRPMPAVPHWPPRGTGKEVGLKGEFLQAPSEYGAVAV